MVEQYSMWLGVSPVSELRENSFTTIPSIEGTFSSLQAGQDDGFFTSEQGLFGTALHMSTHSSMHTSAESTLLTGDMDLLTFLPGAQQGPQAVPEASAAMREEQDIDAQIERLMQLKHALHQQKNQQGQQQQQGLQPQQQQSVVILEGLPFAESSLSGAPSLAVSSGSACSSSLALPLDSNLLDLGWGGPSAAARAARQPARHSVDLGGLAQHMSTLNMSSISPSYSMASDPAASQAGSRRNSVCVTLPCPAFGSTSDLGAAAAVAAAAAAAASGGALPPASGLPPASALYAMPPPAAAGGPAAAAAAAATALGAATALDGPFAGLAGRPRPARRDRMSLDIPLSGTRPAWQASGLTSPAGGCLDPGLLAAQAAQAAWLAGAAGGVTASGRRLSLDVPVSRTPDVRGPPKKTPSSLTNASSSSSSGSARNSPSFPMGAQQGQGQGQQSAFASAAAQRGCGSNGSGVGVAHQAPKWAGSAWHPMADVVRSGQLANKGTGVFIPGGVKTTA